MLEAIHPQFDLTGSIAPAVISVTVSADNRWERIKAYSEIFAHRLSTLCRKIFLFGDLDTEFE